MTLSRWCVLIEMALSMAFFVYTPAMAQSQPSQNDIANSLPSTNFSADRTADGGRLPRPAPGFVNARVASNPQAPDAKVVGEKTCVACHTLEVTAAWAVAVAGLRAGPRRATLQSVVRRYICAAARGQHQLDHIDVALAIGLHSTQLRLLMKALGIQHLYISGIAGCIRLPGEGQRCACGIKSQLLRAE
jgi:cytochrome c5